MSRKLNRTSRSCLRLRLDVDELTMRELDHAGLVFIHHGVQDTPGDAIIPRYREVGRRMGFLLTVHHLVSSTATHPRRVSKPFVSVAKTSLPKTHNTSK